MCSIYLNRIERIGGCNQIFIHSFPNPYNKQIQFYNSNTPHLILSGDVNFTSFNNTKFYDYRENHNKIINL